MCSYPSILKAVNIVSIMLLNCYTQIIMSKVLCPHPNFDSATNVV